MPTINTNNGVPNVELIDSNKMASGPWYQFFVSLWQRTGGAAGTISPILDTLTNTVGSLLFRGVEAWQGLNPGSQFQVLEIGANETPQWTTISGKNFGAQGANEFFVAPDAATGLPTFRAIVSDDLVSVAGEYPGTQTNDSANTGNVGEYIFSSIASGAAVNLVSGTTSNITSITLTAGDWDVWGNVALSAAPTSGKGWINTVSITDPLAPNGGAYSAWTTQTVISIGQQRLSLGGSAPVYLSTNVSFAGAVAAYGFIGARRRR